MHTVATRPLMAEYSVNNRGPKAAPLNRVSANHGKQATSRDPRTEVFNRGCLPLAAESKAHERAHLLRKKQILKT